MTMLRFRSRLLPAVLLCLMLLLAVRADLAAELLRSRIDLCLRTLIPSLFGCTVFGCLLCASGADALLGRRFRQVAKLLHMPENVFGIFLVSQLAGYPVGAALLRQSASRGELTSEQAAAFSYVCFGGGPAFLVGLAGKQLFGSAAAGGMIMLCCILSNLVMAFLLRQKASGSAEIPVPQPHLTAKDITGAVSAAMDTMMKICAMVLFFGIAEGLLRVLHFDTLLTAAAGLCGVPAHTARAFFAAVLDVTQLSGLFGCGLSFGCLLPLAAGLLSFGGICVQLQCAALGAETLRFHRLLLVRLCCAFLTAALTALLLPLLPPADRSAMAAAAIQRAAVSKTGSILPGFLIFLTGFPFLLKKD